MCSVPRVLVPLCSTRVRAGRGFKWMTRLSSPYPMPPSPPSTSCATGSSTPCSCTYVGGRDSTRCMQGVRACILPERVCEGRGCSWVTEVTPHLSCFPCPCPVRRADTACGHAFVTAACAECCFPVDTAACAECCFPVDTAACAECCFPVDTAACAE